MPRQGIFCKWKKREKEASRTPSKTYRERPIEVSPYPYKPREKPKPKSPSKKRTVSFRDCQGRNHDDSEKSEVDTSMESIDLRTPPPMYYKPNTKKSEEASRPRPRSSLISNSNSSLYSKNLISNSSSSSSKKNETIKDSGSNNNNNKSKDSHVKKNSVIRLATKTMSMLTPDMLEVLGLLECRHEPRLQACHQDMMETLGLKEVREEPDPPLQQSQQDMRGTLSLLELEEPPLQKYQQDQHRNHATAAMRCPATEVLAEPRTKSQLLLHPREAAKRKKKKKKSKKNRNSNGYNYNDAVSCLTDVFTDVDDSKSVATASTQSSREAFETPPTRDPEDEDTLYTFENDGEKMGYQQPYRDAVPAGGDCDTAVNLFAMALSVPVGCGLLCVDQFFGTDYFDQATESYRPASKAEMDTETLSTSNSTTDSFTTEPPTETDTDATENENENANTNIDMAQRCSNRKNKKRPKRPYSPRVAPRPRRVGSRFVQSL